MEFPSNQSRLPGFATFTVVPAEQPDAGAAGQRSGGGTITLPLPEGLGYTDGIEYENTDLGLVRGAIVEASAADQSKKASEKGGAAGGEEPPSEKQGDDKSAFQQLMAEIGIRMGGDTGRLLVGSAPNPNTRAVFKKVGMRQYQFTYKLVPTSTDEADSIQEIIKKFRETMYPIGEGISGDLITSFKFPNLFQIEFWIGTPKQAVKPLILPSYLSSMTTSYGGAIMAKNDANFSFSETTISLTFMEYRALNQRDIQAGF